MPADAVAVPPPASTDADVAIAAARAGADVVRAAFGSAVVRHPKGGGDFATQTDLDAERAIRELLAAARPDDGFVGEESGVRGPSDATRRWYVDPLCGTLNFAAGVPPFGVNVALAEARNGAPERFLASAVADPLAGEVLWCDARGAFLRGPAGESRLVPSARSRLVDVTMDGSRDVVGPGLVADPAFRTEFAVRASSTSLALAWVAAGRRAAYVTDASADGSVHFAPGVALCEAAGCVVTDLTGGPVHGGRGLIVAADVATSERIRELVGRLPD